MELQQYKLRISPPRHRKARVRDKAPPLPDVIHIQTAIQSNASFIDNLFSNEAWDGHTEEAETKSGDIRRRKNSTKPPAKTPQRGNAWDKPLISRGSTVTGNKSVLAATSESRSREDTAPMQHSSARQVRENMVDERSLTSTQGSTMASDPSIQAKLDAIEQATKEKFKTLQESNRKSTQKLQQLEKQLQRFDDVDRKLGTMETDIQSVARQLDSTVESQQNIVESIHAIKESTTTQYNRLSSHLITSGENVNHLTDAVTAIKNEMARLSHIMQDLATRQYDQIAPSSTISPTSVQVNVHVPQNDSCSTQQAPNNAVSDMRKQSVVAALPSSPDSMVHPISTTANISHQHPSQLSDSSAEQLRDTARQIPLPDSSSDNSIASTTSKKSHGSTNTVASDESEISRASSTVRSPPPKKTRQGGIPCSSPVLDTMHVDSDMDAPDDQDVFNGDIDMFDAVLDDALRMNLNSRFDASVYADQDHPLTQDQNDTPEDHRLQLQSVSTTMKMEAEHSMPVIPNTAPLDSRNTTHTILAGAETS